MSDSPKSQRPTIKETIEQLLELVNLSATKVIEIKQQLDAAVIKIQPYIRNFIENVNAIPWLTRDLSVKLQHRGWYILPQFTFTEFRKLIEAAYNDDFDLVDALMSELVRENTIEIAADLIQRFPHRAALLAEAFENHRCARYASAITLLLTQSDGFCKDLLEVPYFSIERQKKSAPPDPRTRGKIE